MTNKNIKTYVRDVEHEEEETGSLDSDQLEDVLEAPEEE